MNYSSRRASDGSYKEKKQREKQLKSVLREQNDKQSESGTYEVGNIPLQHDNKVAKRPTVVKADHQPHSPSVQHQMLALDDPRRSK